MDIKKVLTDAGIDAEIAEKASKSIKADIGKEFVSKEQYNKKAGLISEIEDKIKTLETKNTDLEAENSKATKYKTDYDNLVVEHNTYKTGVEKKENNATKSTKLRESLKADGFNEKIIPLLTKEFDLDKMEIAEDKIKGWEELSKGVKESYKDFITITNTGGTPPANPPNGNGKAETTMTLGSALHEKYKL